MAIDIGRPNMSTLNFSWAADLKRRAERLLTWLNETELDSLVRWFQLDVNTHTGLNFDTTPNAIIYALKDRYTSGQLVDACASLFPDKLPLYFKKSLTDEELDLALLSKASTTDLRNWVLQYWCKVSSTVLPCPGTLASTHQHTLLHTLAYPASLQGPESTMKVLSINYRRILQKHEDAELKVKNLVRLSCLTVFFDFAAQGMLDKSLLCLCAVSAIIMLCQSFGKARKSG